MTFKFSQRSRDRAKRVDPVLMLIAADALAHCAVDFGLTEEQSRTYAEQAEKVRLGYSKTMNSKHMIPKGGQYSTALDLVPFVDGKFHWGDGMWRVRTLSGETLEPFYEIAAAMRDAAVRAGKRVIWGAVWDKALNDLPAGAKAMKAAVEAYKVRHKGADFLDGPHFQLV